MLGGDCRSATARRSWNTSCHTRRGSMKDLVHRGEAAIAKTTSPFSILRPIGHRTTWPSTCAASSVPPSPYILAASSENRKLPDTQKPWIDCAHPLPYSRNHGSLSGRSLGGSLSPSSKLVTRVPHPLHTHDKARSLQVVSTSEKQHDAWTPKPTAATLLDSRDNASCKLMSGFDCMTACATIKFLRSSSLGSAAARFTRMTDVLARWILSRDSRVWQKRGSPAKYCSWSRASSDQLFAISATASGGSGLSSRTTQGGGASVTQLLPHSPWWKALNGLPGHRKPPPRMTTRSLSSLSLL
mmetsp:Transcript_117698/g.333004  ORF Transcript_117698/g.333004 Transcript_117698/m.333004 type:complete len:299 (-) Transcript_117698:1038-1934(-)